MKTIIVKMMVLVFMPLAAFTQAHSIDKLYEKYTGTEGFTSINITADMFKLISSLNNGVKSENGREVQEVISQLSGMKILVYDQVKEGLAGFDKETLKAELRQIINQDDFRELMTIKEKDSDVRFLTRQGPDNKISELLMVSVDGKEVVIMSFAGRLDLKSLGKLSGSLNIDMKGMDKMEKLNQD